MAECGQGHACDEGKEVCLMVQDYGYYVYHKRRRIDFGYLQKTSREWQNRVWTLKTEEEGPELENSRGRFSLSFKSRRWGQIYLGVRQGCSHSCEIELSDVVCLWEEEYKSQDDRILIKRPEDGNFLSYHNNSRAKKLKLKASRAHVEAIIIVPVEDSD